ncbi:hypothetical protein AcW1_007103 [Taiwanofungus camphoratus]|nr:hypothetical protein AcV5_005395 [Antrodia cinnamomea]KAI0925240.1 hypothetical protein AcW2_005914 [Antrodia cinnamomea]KAI0929560.1 hypothetical protein AcV7_005056 [Antrodia cinnamomea]KAI0955550.1 hypothetical protein AcW1_007103 [Antrodia cinnamomea]
MEEKAFNIIELAIEREETGRGAHAARGTRLAGACFAFDFHSLRRLSQHTCSFAFLRIFSGSPCLKSPTFSVCGLFSHLILDMAEKLDAPTTSSTDTGSSPKENNSTVGPKAIIKNVDMSEDMQQESVDIASAALEKYNIEKDIAAQIKKEFDRRHGPTWHVVVGKNFGSYVTHETKHFIYFYIGSLAILIWKS